MPVFVENNGLRLVTQWDSQRKIGSCLVIAWLSFLLRIWSIPWCWAGDGDWNGTKKYRWYYPCGVVEISLWYFMEGLSQRLKFLAILHSSGVSPHRFPNLIPSKSIEMWLERKRCFLHSSLVFEELTNPYSKSHIKNPQIRKPIYSPSLHPMQNLKPTSIEEVTWTRKEGRRRKGRGRTRKPSPSMRWPRRERSREGGERRANR